MTLRWVRDDRDRASWTCHDERGYRGGFSARIVVGRIEWQYWTRTVSSRDTGSTLDWRTAVSRLIERIEHEDRVLAEHGRRAPTRRPGPKRWRRIPNEPPPLPPLPGQPPKQ